MASFPLKCIICSDEHSYSDTSHLLTHMSSKRHLAAQFKATVRARQDPLLAQKLDDFDKWYNENNLAELLAQRLAKKDEKKLEAQNDVARIARRRNSRKTKNEDLRNNDSQEQHGNGLLYNANHTMLSIPIDPDMLIKEEPDLQELDQDGNYFTHPEQHSIYGEPYHSMHASVADRDKKSWSYIENSFDNQRSSHPDTEFSWISRPSGSCMAEDGSFSNNSILDSMEEIDFNHDELMVNALERFNNSSEEAEGEDHEEYSPLLAKRKISKLKGVIWPGMRLFDAASPEGIRMRNQRKKFEISGTLQRSSQQTQPTEVVYYARTWKFKEGRVIDGEVHSPPPEDLPPPVKRPRRRALAEKSANQIIRRTYRKRGPYRRINKLSEAENMSPTPNLSERMSFDDEQHDTGSLLENRGFYGSPLKLEPHHDQYESQDHRSQSTVYPFMLNHGFNRIGSSLEKTHLPGDQDGSDFPYYTAPIGTLQNISNIRQPVTGFANKSSCGLSRDQVPDRFRYQELPGLRKPPVTTRHRQSLPSISSFGRLYSLSKHDQSVYQAPYPQNTTRDKYAEEPKYGQNRIIQSGSTITKSNEPKTPVQVRDDYSRYILAHENTYEDSSGDETIDQGIDDTPTRYLTRSAVRQLKADSS